MSGNMDIKETGGSFGEAQTWLSLGNIPWVVGKDEETRQANHFSSLYNVLDQLWGNQLTPV